MCTDSAKCLYFLHYNKGVNKKEIKSCECRYLGAVEIVLLIIWRVGLWSIIGSVLYIIDTDPNGTYLRERCHREYPRGINTQRA
jgi:hypothetical protein